MRETLFSYYFLPSCLPAQTVHTYTPESARIQLEMAPPQLPMAGFTDELWMLSGSVVSSVPRLTIAMVWRKLPVHALMKAAFPVGASQTE